jgi:hypothetical protein
MRIRLPLVFVAVGRHTAVIEDYEGAALVLPQDPVAARTAFRQPPDLRGETCEDPHSWGRIATRPENLIEQRGDSFMTCPSVASNLPMMATRSFMASAARAGQDP